ncbi:MgtC/SapB family protein [Desulfogranum marinum]|uniref:MgtC/SapB family protein n=1 Tax=Desulfogranum marinum TaxID=453220 RepID=UPI0019630A22|nr:MgtC/SapB family protein [Desulfogranum marinum]MBM9514048.1 MgtC/SapB family protein [Desulfogranum marinum]
MTDSIIYQHFETYVLAMLLGALLGLERERKERRLAGLRTFILVVLFGAICGQLSQIIDNQWLLMAGMLAVAAQTITVQILRLDRGNEEPGLTTLSALLIAFTIGALVAFDLQSSAVALSLATTVILYFKPQLHAFTHRLKRQDLVAIFQFCLLAFVILPVLPNHSYGPYGTLNPYNIWLMVVMISGFNVVGYVTLKLIGSRWGGPFLGLIGGLVSSTATTFSISRHARANPTFSMTGALVIALASAIALVRMALLIGVIYLPLLEELVVPLGTMFIGGLVPALWIWHRLGNKEVPVPETKNPAELKQAVLFGMLYAIILVAVSGGKDFFGEKGVYIVALLSGLTDVDAITLSNSRLAGQEVLALSQAGISLLIAFVANLAFKLALVGFIGTMKMTWYVLLCFAGLAVPAVIVMW